MRKNKYQLFQDLSVESTCSVEQGYTGIFALNQIAKLYQMPLQMPLSSNISLSTQFTSFHESSAYDTHLNLMQLAKRSGFYAKCQVCSANLLNPNIFPAIAWGVQGYFVVLGVCNGDYITVHLGKVGLQRLDEKEFEACFSNQLILIRPLYERHENTDCFC